MSITVVYNPNIPSTRLAGAINSIAEESSANIEEVISFAQLEGVYHYKFPCEPLTDVVVFDTRQLEELISDVAEEG